MACGYCSSTRLAGACPVCSPGAAGAPYVRPTKKKASRRTTRATQPRPPAPAPRPAPVTTFPKPPPPRPTPAPLPMAAMARRPQGGLHRAAPVAEGDGYRERPAARGRNRWDSMGAEQRRGALVGIRRDMLTRDFNAVAGRLAHLADETKGQARVMKLTELDARCLLTGQLSREDEAVRSAIVAECVAELGFDPRVDDGPLATVVPLVPPTAAARGLPSGELPPLVAGDWAELGRRVAAGYLSEEDARGFGAVWMEQLGAIRA